MDGISLVHYTLKSIRTLIQLTHFESLMIVFLFILFSPSYHIITLHLYIADLNAYCAPRYCDATPA